jgi:hypothetical protein
MHAIVGHVQGHLYVAETAHGTLVVGHPGKEAMPDEHRAQIVDLAWPWGCGFA